MLAYTTYDFDARVRREAETLAADGFQVRCLTARSGPTPRRYRLNGVEVVELNVPKYRGKSRLAYAAAYLAFLVATSFSCIRLLIARELDVVHAHNLPDFLVFAGLVPRLAGRKVILDVHDSVPETFAAKFSRVSIVWSFLCLEERMSAFVAHKIICVNQPQRDVLVSRGIPARKILVSMNAPDPAIFRPTPILRSSLPETSFDLVYHGTMSKRLGVDLIIRAVAASSKDIPGLRLHLWGMGDDLKDFEALVDSLGLQGRVAFNPRGYALHELPERLRSMHVGIIGNRRSPAGELMLPVKLLEYVAMGIPAVVPRLKAIEHYFGDEMVSYYEPENVEAMSGSIRLLHAHPDRRERQAAHAARVIEEYGWDRQGREFVQVYKSLVPVDGL